MSKLRLLVYLWNCNTQHQMVSSSDLPTSVQGDGRLVRWLLELSWRLMKMENVVPRAGTEPSGLIFWVSVQTISPGRLPDITILPTPTWLCSSLLETSVQTTTLVPQELKAFWCIQLHKAVSANTYTQGRFNNHLHCLCRILVMEPVSVGLMKRGNIVTKAGVEPTPRFTSLQHLRWYQDGH